MDVISSSFDGNYGYRGGAIVFDWVRATVVDSTFSNNSAFVAGGALEISRGSVVRVDASTIHENLVSAYDGACDGGGGIYNQGSLTLTNSTLWKNVSQCGGGGIANTLGGIATILNSTIADNGATTGGGVYNSGDTVTLKNTIVANSSAQRNCYGTVDAGGNLSYPDATCGGKNLNPLLGALADNGGPTQTMALGDGRRGHRRGDDCGVPGRPDQRPRPARQSTLCRWRRGYAGVVRYRRV